MHYQMLVAGVNAYNRKEKKEGFPEKLYDEEPDYFKALDGNVPISERVGLIVNKWGKCRVSINDERLKKALKVFETDYRPVTGWKLNEISLWECHDQIVNGFCNFAEVVKYTGASKLLHILNPQFFMMWDDAIRYGYGCSENGEGYFNFLYRSQREIQEVLQTYRTEHDATKEISQRIYNGQTKSILKLLDEYNWAKYTEMLI